MSTLNVQGLNLPLKKQLIFEYMHNEDLDIVSVTKTKLAQKEDLRRSLTNQYFYVYMAVTLEDLGLKRESSMGTHYSLNLTLDIIYTILRAFWEQRL